MTSTAAGLPRIRVDFNLLGGFDEIWAGLGRVDPSLREGDEFIAYDPDDDLVLCARARVTRIDREKGLLFMRVDGDTFFREEHPTPPAAGAGLTGGPRWEH